MHIYLYKNNSLITRINSPSIEDYVKYCPTEYRDCIASEEKIKNPITENNIVREATVEEVLSLDEYKQYKRNELKKQRDLSITQDYNHNGVMYQADLISQDNFFQSLMLKETNVNWISSDNTIHNLMYDDFVSIVDGMKERKKESFIKFNDLYNEVLLCETIDEIKVIVW